MSGMLGGELGVRKTEPTSAPGFKSTKQTAELRFRTLLTEGTPEVKLALA
jgi:hypothetical protein